MIWIIVAIVVVGVLFGLLMGGALDDHKREPSSWDRAPSKSIEESVRLRQIDEGTVHPIEYIPLGRIARLPVYPPEGHYFSSQVVVVEKTVTKKAPEPEDWRCRYCGTKNDGEVRVCEQCGGPDR